MKFVSFVRKINDWNNSCTIQRFQNKRAKIKKSSGQKNPLALQLMAQGLYNHSTVPLTREEEELQEMQERASVEAAAKTSSMVSSEIGDEDEEDNDWEQILIQNIWNNNNFCNNVFKNAKLRMKDIL